MSGVSIAVHDGRIFFLFNIAQAHVEAVTYKDLIALHPGSNATRNVVARPRSANGASRTAQNDNGHHYGNVKGGWWIQAGDLKAGQRLLTGTGGIAEVISVEIEDTAFDAYNLTVADFHTYFVRSGDGKLGGAPPSPDHATNDNASAIWVHNSDCLIRNAHLAGKTHPKTGIPFSKDGFPVFDSVATHSVNITQTGNRAHDFAAANKAAGLNATPKGFTWHHHQDLTTMQLVPTEIHRATGHTGGVGLLKK